jgi:hypothetical protein
MTEQSFKPVAEWRQRKNWQSVRTLRKNATAKKDYALADFCELLEKIITGRHFLRTITELTAKSSTPCRRR